MQFQAYWHLLLVILPSFVTLCSADQTLAAGSGLASWSKTTNKKENDPEIHVYYTALLDGTTRAIQEKNYIPTWESWTDGNLKIPLGTFKLETPLTVVRWSVKENKKDVDQIRLYFLDTDAYPVEKSYEGSAGWVDGTKRIGPQAHSLSKGIAAVRFSDGRLRVYMQLQDGSIQERGYGDGAWGGGANFGGALIGTSITSFLDDASNIHVYYQSNVAPFSIVEQYYDLTKENWSSGTIYSSAAQNIQLAATAGKNQPAQFFATNDQLYNYVQWAEWQRNDPSCGGWCLPTSLAWTNTYKSSLAVTTWSDQTRVYYVNEKGNLAELSNVDWGGNWTNDYYGTGWGITMVDVVNNKRPA